MSCKKHVRSIFQRNDFIYLLTDDLRIVYVYESSIIM